MADEIDTSTVSAYEVPEWVLRLVDEETALGVKLTAAHSFTGTEAYQNISQRARDLLQEQIGYMTGYYNALGARIEQYHEDAGYTDETEPTDDG